MENRSYVLSCYTALFYFVMVRRYWIAILSKTTLVLWKDDRGSGATTARAEVDYYGGTRLDYNINHTGEWPYISIDNIYVTSGQINVGFYVDSPGGTVLHIDEVRVTKK